MSTIFYIVDDDIVIQNVLKNIILKHNLGDVGGTSGSGLDAIKEINKLNPDIVLVDMLLPDIDGIGLISKLKEMYCKSTFIVISQVTAKEMISKAYEKGVEFYINKPINVIEVISVIKKVIEKINMLRVIQSFETAFSNMNTLKEYVSGKESKPIKGRDKIEKILAQLGILGEAGTNDIINIVLWLQKHDDTTRDSLLKYKMSEVYNVLNNRYNEERTASSNIGAIEQRVRRAINKALENISNIGIEDYGNDIFVKYSGTLFDFTEVRKQMDHNRGKSNYGGKISAKKFIEGIIISLKDI